MEQETRKISASQLATALAKADGERAAKKEGESAPDDASAPRPAASQSPPPASAPPQVLAVVERPVGDAKVVNVTSPETPAHSSGRLPAAKPAEREPEPEPAAAPPEAPPKVKYESLPVRLPVSSPRLGAALVVFLFLACCVVLVLLDH